MLLRILTLPIAMLAFIILFVVANKLPHTVETTNLVVWILLLILIVAKLIRAFRKNTTLN